MKNPKPYLMKNGSWAMKGTSSVTGITLFRIVGKKPSMSNVKIDLLKNIFTSRKCECDRFC